MVPTRSVSTPSLELLTSNRCECFDDAQYLPTGPGEITSLKALKPFNKRPFRSLTWWVVGPCGPLLANSSWQTLPRPKLTADTATLAALAEVEPKRSFIGQVYEGLPMRWPSLQNSTVR